MKRRIWIPATVIIGAIVALIGCIPIPATQQLQADLTPRPEYFIGHDSCSPIWLGHTSIEDAFALLTRKTSSQTNPAWPGEYVSHQIDVFEQWRVSADRHQFAVRYRVRTSTVVYPFCFFSESNYSERWLVLDVDDRHVVVGSRTSRFVPLGLLPSPDYTEIFDEAARKRLHDAGVLPSDFVLRQRGIHAPTFPAASRRTAASRPTSLPFAR